ncbi:MAG: SelT/SelW/SelH family protein [Gemmatimonadetes bacterium]|uniref:SelT/SelW/SelH family protein n=1 Tax=Candidatus Kutchimonas denitrificans TaxID=3056748 RepID=A0AAE4Z9H1_9BACT|nr:SelT/SelW/SelH family protein [Gemmatimonadota bacterium]NIR76118.1 SelT/SelW/SelH family protein [Candidatus Kutchimonas denitrificans]NIS00497.1 SelT/SelW/SelH family protein [Gemmatimonadota bacterium]NIT66155.1 SelT/SelW/SelH family protein [Gemmatimonadota bacterium]NIU54233.1 SelT/SelW/SelH family protein [Gemmatimonadota bacterium]
MRTRFDPIDVELVESSGGAFEVRREGDLVFSKLKRGRFPEEDELFELLAE